MRKALVSILFLLLLAMPRIVSAAIIVLEEPGSDPILTQNVRQVTEAFDSVMSHEMNANVTQDVRVIVTPNRDSYAIVLQRELGQPKDAAERSARVTSGFFAPKRHAIALNGDAPQMKYLGGVASVVAHELFHQIQGQLEGLERYRLYWMSEGTADYVGALVADRLGVLNLEGWKKQRINILRKTPNHASPQEMDNLTLAQWTTLMEQKKAPYEIADLMVFFLLDQSNRKSLSAIAEYFRRCGNLKDGKKALSAAFGLDADTFADRFSVWLANLMGQSGSVEVEAFGTAPAAWIAEVKNIAAITTGLLAVKWNIPLQSNLRIVVCASVDNFTRALTHELGIAPEEAEKFRTEAWRYTRGTAVIQASAYSSGQARVQAESEMLSRMWFADAIPASSTNRLYWLHAGGIFYTASLTTDSLIPGSSDRKRDFWLRQLDGETPSLRELAELQNYQASVKRLGNRRVEAVSSLATALLLEKYGVDSYGKWLRAAKEKSDPRIAFAAVYGLSWEAFADEFAAWLAPRLKKAS